MKLRNKKTGESLEIDKLPEEVKLALEIGATFFWYNYEIYEPAEPLIKDEKVRKAVRAWAELHELENVFYFAYSIHKELSYLKSKDTGVVIDIVALPELEDGEIYTLAELCGEEEE